MYNDFLILLDPLFLFKIILLIILFVFIIFMLVVLNRVRVMAKVVNQPRTIIIVTVGVILLLSAASLFLTALVIL